MKLSSSFYFLFLIMHTNVHVTFLVYLAYLKLFQNVSTLFYSSLILLKENSIHKIESVQLSLFNLKPKLLPFMNISLVSKSFQIRENRNS
jgi:hypothetical protein